MCNFFHRSNSIPFRYGQYLFDVKVMTHVKIWSCHVHPIMILNKLIFNDYTRQDRQVHLAWGYSYLTPHLHRSILWTAASFHHMRREDNSWLDPLITTDIFMPGLLSKVWLSKSCQIRLDMMAGPHSHKGCNGQLTDLYNAGEEPEWKIKVQNTLLANVAEFITPCWPYSKLMFWLFKMYIHVWSRSSNS